MHWNLLVCFKQDVAADAVFAHLFSKFFHERFIFFVRGEVDGFVGVGFVVVEFAVVDGAAFDPFDVAVAVGAVGIAHAASAEDADDAVAYGGFGIVEHRDEAASLNFCGGLESGEVAEGGVEVDEAHRVCCFSRHWKPGRADDERYAGGLFHVGVFAPFAMVAEVEAVVAPEDDDGVVGNAKLVEFF